MNPKLLALYGVQFSGARSNTPNRGSDTDIRKFPIVFTLLDAIIMKKLIAQCRGALAPSRHGSARTFACKRLRCAW